MSDSKDSNLANIVVSQGGKPYIIDFYTATLEAAGQKIRTPAFTELYMSPEVIKLILFALYIYL